MPRLRILAHKISSEMYCVSAEIFVSLAENSAGFVSGAGLYEARGVLLFRSQYSVLRFEDSVVAFRFR